MSLKTLEWQLLTYYTQQPATGEQPAIEDLTLLSSGWASDVYRFTLRYQQMGKMIRQKLVLKLYANTPEGMDRALKERHALFHLRSEKYPVPGVSEVEIDPQHLGRPFVIMEYIEGELLWDALTQAEGEQRDSLIRLFVGLLIDLHQRGLEILIPTLKPMSDLALINREIYTLKGMINTYHREEFTPIVDWLREHRDRGACDKPTAAHRDYHPWNVMIDGQGNPFVIDWAWQVADARYDLAWTLTLLERSGYKGVRDEVLAEYQRVTGSPVSELDYFEVLTHVRWLMDVTHSLKYGENLREETKNEFRAVVSAWVRYAAADIHSKTGIVLPVEQLLQ
ncbi:MAG: phosphotransferase [Anaerolineae bacterium]|jgi:aminoglycoside phosphotransferase (APT) family kinase protein|nr:phosphotransferase [Anaerolineae bacterium]